MGGVRDRGGGGIDNPVRRVTEGELLAGRYELGAVLGRGGMAEVRAGRDLRLGRAVAVKTLRPDLAEQPGVRRRFEREAQAAARLAHPNVVAVHDVGEQEGIPYIVMERVAGPTLHQEMIRGPMDSARARWLGREILAALGAAHAAGLVHRDVKPSNVLLAADDSAKVTDFGIAKAADDGGSTADIDLTAAGQVVGTVAYMASERLAGEPATVPSDLYSVGVILYEALSGTRPFAGDTPISLAWAIRHARPQPLAELRPDLDSGLVAVVERAMAHRPEERFATAAEMAAALRAEGAVGTDAAPTIVAHPPTQVLDARPMTANRSAPGSPASRSRRKLGVLAVAGLLAVLAVAASGAWDGEGDPGGAGRPAPETGIPAPLDDALDRLEETVR